MDIDSDLPGIVRGRCEFRLGTGLGATGGSIEIELRHFPIPTSTPSVAVEWRAETNEVPQDARQQTVSYIEKFLRGYLICNRVGSLHVAVVRAGWFSDRLNETERAAWNALHEAITRARLPPPILYAAPDE
jgi:hypothetical protein